MKNFRPVTAGNRSSITQNFRTRLALSTALATIAFGYAGRVAYAGSCVVGVPGTYLCSGFANPGTDVTQTLSPGAPLTVTTDSTFSIDTSTSGGNALTLTGTGGVSFTTSNNFSQITGASRGIYASNNGSGALSITASAYGTVTGTSFDGIRARNNADTTDLTISARNVNGGIGGIYANNLGTGITSVTASDFGQVTATSSFSTGITARNSAAATGDMTVSAGNVTGDSNGIYARNDGSGALSVTASSFGQVTGTNSTGIRANNGVAGTDITVSAGNVTGAYTAMSVFNSGTGATSVTVAGQATGSVFGSSGSNSTGDVTVLTAGVTSTSSGVSASTSGTGSVNLTSTGPVTAGTTNSTGIFASGVNGNVTVSAADVTSGGNGVFARTFGTGSVSVTTTGQVTGTNYDGLTAISYDATGTDVTVSAVNVTGGRRGIYARNNGSGTQLVTVNGTVTGGTDEGIGTITGAGKSTTITLNFGADVSSASGTALTNDDGNSTTLVNLGASVTGTVSLGGGNDDLTFDGGNFSNVTTLDGGADTDTLTFRNVNATAASANLVNWENVLVDAGATVALDGNVTTTDLTVAGGGNFTQTSGLVTASGTLTNNATATVSNLSAGAVLNDFGAQLSLQGAVGGAVNNYGNLTATGLTTVTGTTTNLGEISAGGGGSLRINGGLLNLALVNLTGGAVTGSGAANNQGVISGRGAITAALTNNAGGTVRAEGGVLNLTNVSGGNAGNLQVASGGIMNVTSALTNTGLVSLEGASATLGGGNLLTNQGTIAGLGTVSKITANQGTVRAEGGRLSMAALGNTNTASGQIQAVTGGEVFFTQGLASNAGQIQLTGGAFDNNNIAMTNGATGVIAGRGTVRTGGLTNDGLVSFANGTSDVTGTVGNNASLDINSATVTFFNAVTNDGTVTSNLSTVNFLGGFINNGTLITDPNIINFTDFTNNDPAAVIAFLDDEFVVSNDVLGDTSNNLVWDTDEAILRYVAGVDSAHTMQLYGIDLGEDIAGLADNFAWGTVDLTAGQTVSLEDIKADGEAGALYLDTILLADFATDIIDGELNSIIGNGFNVYYNAAASGNGFLGGLNYNLQNGGQLIALSGEASALPAPSSAALFLLGLSGFGRLWRRKSTSA